MPPPSDKGPILVVDDDDDLREAILATLEQDGYATAEATDGSDALRYLRANPLPSLILLDWNMAPMNGAGFLTEFVKEARYAAIPVVLLTADAGIEEKAQMPGLVGALKKPVKLDDLFAIVNRYCS